MLQGMRRTRPDAPVPTEAPLGAEGMRQRIQARNRVAARLTSRLRKLLRDPVANAHSAGLALLEFRRQQLHRNAGCRTWTAYLATRLSLSRARANRLLAVASHFDHAAIRTYGSGVLFPYAAFLERTSGTAPPDLKKVLVRCPEGELPLHRLTSRQATRAFRADDPVVLIGQERISVRIENGEAHLMISMPLERLTQRLLPTKAKRRQNI